MSPSRVIKTRKSRPDQSSPGYLPAGGRMVAALIIVGIASVSLILSWDRLIPFGGTWKAGLVAPADVYAARPVEVGLPDGGTVSVLAREAVVRRGDRISERQEAVLKSLAAASGGKKVFPLVIGNILFAMALVTLGAVFIVARAQKMLHSRDGLLLFMITLVATVAAMKSLQVSRAGAVMNLLFNPIPASTILLALVLGQEAGILGAIFLAPVFGCLISSGVRGVTVSYALLGGVVGALSVSRRRSQRQDIIKAGIVVGAFNALLAVSFSLSSLVPGALETLSSFYGAPVAGFLNGLTCSIIVIGMVPLLERSFKITTTTKLQELINPSHPLLRRLINEAPGTYHHSVNVGYLAEGAAKVIGADGYLARAAAHFHDIGKLKRPYFFTENQIGGVNYHDNLSPHLSRLIITSHTKDGFELARQFALPKAVCDIILQHHGSDLVSYFYHGAKKQETDKELVEEHTFRYPGPKPQSREAAVIMLADAVEAAARSLEKPSPTAIERMVTKITNDRFIDGQFDECDLTKKDIELIAENLSLQLSGMYHSRISYPEDDELLSRAVENGQATEEAG